MDEIGIQGGQVQISVLRALDDEPVLLGLLVVFGLDRNVFRTERRVQAAGTLRRGFFVLQIDLGVHQQRLQHGRIDQPAHAVDHGLRQEILLGDLRERFLVERLGVGGRIKFGIFQRQFEQVFLERVIVLDVTLVLPCLIL